MFLRLFLPHAAAYDHVEAGVERKNKNRPMIEFKIAQCSPNQPSSWVVNKIGSGLAGKQAGGIRAPSLPFLMRKSRSNHQPIAAWSDLFFLIGISSFELFAGTDMHYHGWSTALFKDPRVLRELRRVPRCRGRDS